MSSTEPLHLVTVLCAWRGRRHLRDNRVARTATLSSPDGTVAPPCGSFSESGCAGDCRVPARPAVWPAVWPALWPGRSGRRGACTRPRQAGRFYQDSQQFHSAEATSAHLPPSLLVNGPAGEASGTGVAGARGLADVGTREHVRLSRRQVPPGRGLRTCPLGGRQRSPLFLSVTLA